ncbi:MAG: hypothetical protein QXL94_01770, partial [Candidatus Parvarchaeum sp.]
MSTTKVYGKDNLVLSEFSFFGEPILPSEANEIRPTIFLQTLRIPDFEIIEGSNFASIFEFVDLVLLENYIRGQVVNELAQLELSSREVLSVIVTIFPAEVLTFLYSVIRDALVKEETGIELAYSFLRNALSVFKLEEVLALKPFYSASLPSKIS